MGNQRTAISYHRLLKGRVGVYFRVAFGAIAFELLLHFGGIHCSNEACHQTVLGTLVVG
jgi:hypothetical protein